LLALAYATKGVGLISFFDGIFYTGLNGKKGKMLVAGVNSVMLCTQDLAV